jgi:hypothetical protein
VGPFCAPISLGGWVPFARRFPIVALPTAKQLIAEMRSNGTPQGKERSPQVGRREARFVAETGLGDYSFLLAPFSSPSEAR